MEMKTMSRTLNGTAVVVNSMRRTSNGMDLGRIRMRWQLVGFELLATFRADGRLRKTLNTARSIDVVGIHV